LKQQRQWIYRIAIFTIRGIAYPIPFEPDAKKRNCLPRLKCLF